MDVHIQCTVCVLSYWCTHWAVICTCKYANVIMYVECVRHTCCTALLGKVLCTCGVPVLHAKHIGQPCVVFIVLQSVWGGTAYLGMLFMYHYVCDILCSSYQNKWTPEGWALVEEHDLWWALVPPGTLCPCQNMLSWGFTVLWYQLEGVWNSYRLQTGTRELCILHASAGGEALTSWSVELSCGCATVDHSLVLSVVLSEGGVAAPICLCL